MSEPHDVVKLLLARMESHPEEFSADSGRWAEWLDQLIPFLTEEERVLLRGPMMQTLHEEVLDELLNGPDRRRKEAEEKNEYERHLAQSLQHMKQQQMQGIVGKSPTSIWLDEYVNTGTITAAKTEPTLSASAINAIKKALKL